MKKMFLVFLVLLVISALLFSASAKEKSAEKIVLTWYQFFYANIQEEYLKPTIAEFEKLHPNVKIELVTADSEVYWDRLTLDIASGVESDIMLIDTGCGIMGSYLQRPEGTFIPLDDYIKGYTLPDGTSLEDDILGIDSIKANGHIIALPFITFMSPMTAYRKSILAKAGVSPAELTTWDSYYEAAKKLTKDVDGDGKIDVYGFGHPVYPEVLSRWWHMHWLWTAGGGIFPNEKPPFTADRLIFNSKENVYAIEFLKKMIDETGPSGPKMLLELNSMFANATLATIQVAVWGFANFEKTMSESDYMNDIGLVPFPSLVFDNKVKKPICVTWGNPLAISSKCKHPKEAFDFIAFMHSKEAQKLAMYWGAPTNKLMYDEYAKIKPKQAELIQRTQNYEMRQVPDIVEWNQLDHIIQGSINSALLGTKGVQEALDWGQQEMEKALR